MNIMGIVTKTHDTGAAILRDGEIAAVMEEERFNRDKHTQLFPVHAIEQALTAAQLDLSDIDVVTTPWDVKQLRQSFRGIVFEHLPKSLNLLKPAAHSTQNSGIVFLTQRLRQGLRRHLGGRKAPPIVEVSHHDSHAAMFFVSPFDEAAVLVVDGYGDSGATSLYTGRENQMSRHMALGFFDSLGALYSSVTMHLGFKIFEEGTVMALAACGDSTLVDRFREVVTLHEDGSFSFNPEYTSFHTHGLIQPFTRKFYDMFGLPRAAGEPLTDQHRDLAAALQTVTEEVIIHLVRRLEKETSSRNLCISGGVALNCVANARVLRETSFDRVWVPPIASDTGAPLGSALWHYHQNLGMPRGQQLDHAYHGASYSNDEIGRALQDVGLSSELLSDDELFARVAGDLANKKIVGWFQGPYEIGPRALGNRSILADPRDLEIKELLNVRIKQREPFRPFAPAVLAERASEFFEIEQPDPFMTMAPRVRDARRADIPAAVHVDGTARIQTVDQSTNPRFHRLISAFGERTGVPVLLNTSFNRQEPIVGGPKDAISCFLRTSMDVLVLGNHYVTDRCPKKAAEAETTFQQEQAAIKERIRPLRSILEC